MGLQELHGMQASFLVFVPTFEQLPGNLPQIERTLNGLEQDTMRRQISVYREDPKVVLVENARLTQTQQQLRREQLGALEAGFFTMLEMAGEGVSSYAREILLCAKQSGIEVHLYASGESSLARYARMLGVA